MLTAATTVISEDSNSTPVPFMNRVSIPFGEARRWPIAPPGSACKLSPSAMLDMKFGHRPKSMDRPTANARYDTK